MPDALIILTAARVDAMSEDEQRVLLALESAAVEHGGRVMCRAMTIRDMRMAQDWSDEAFIRLAPLINVALASMSTHAVELSPAAWQCAAEVRRRFAVRYQAESVKASLQKFEEATR